MEYVRKNYISENENEFCDFLTRMYRNCKSSHSRIVLEWLRNAPYFEMFQLDKLGIWRENNEIVASLQLLSPWNGYVRVDNLSDTKELLIDIVRYAEETFSGMENDKKYIAFFINEKENDFKEILRQRDYEELTNEFSTLQYSLSDDIPQVEIPDGFVVKTLAEVYDFDQLCKLIWEGFNYKGPIPKIDDEVYLPIKHAWLNYNRDICTVILAPDGTYASFSGFWHEKETQTGYLEPMITGKEYRNLGLGKLAVYNSLKILKSYGCKKVFVDPDDEPYNYYCKLGFEKWGNGQYFKKILE